MRLLRLQGDSMNTCWIESKVLRSLPEERVSNLEEVAVNHFRRKFGIELNVYNDWPESLLTARLFYMKYYRGHLAFT